MDSAGAVDVIDGVESPHDVVPDAGGGWWRRWRRKERRGEGSERGGKGANRIGRREQEDGEKGKRERRKPWHLNVGSLRGRVVFRMPAKASPLQTSAFSSSSEQSTDHAASSRCSKGALQSQHANDISKWT